MTSETTAKKDIQKLQRTIVDGLEDVKAQDIVVFNTEQLSPLFERVIVASGTSNRQTRALAASVRDAVREAGFDKPRIEGEENGEWIIVDCGVAVVHVMQPIIRQYYRLEEIWGAKPVRLKHGVAKPLPVQSIALKTTKKAAKKASTIREAQPVDAKSVRRKTARVASVVAAAAAPLPAAAKSPSRKAVRPLAQVAANTSARNTAAGGASAQSAQSALPTVLVKPKRATRPAASAATQPAVRVAVKKTAQRSIATRTAAKSTTQKKG